jgi:uncharacterized repeat protein (TIGR03803 family)
MTSRKHETMHEAGRIATWATGRQRSLGLLRSLLAAGITLLPLIGTRTAAQGTAPRYKVLYNFTGGAYGGGPTAGLIRDAAGNLYSTTSGGGNTSSSCPYGSQGCGVVFKLDPSGKETVLYTFSGGVDGGNPYTRLLRDAAGNLYGTTGSGGNTSSSCPYGSQGCGVVFKLDSSGKETVLYTFSGGADGNYPVAGLIQDGSGNLYGTTTGGGNTGGSCGGSGCGVVFKLDPQGDHYKVLYAFTGGADGNSPFADLIQDADGNLYGTTNVGGYLGSACGGIGCGVVFKLDPSGRETVLHTFRLTDGASPLAGLVQDASGNLYGTTQQGGNTSSSCPAGAGGCGVVFELDPRGHHYKVLYAFTGGADGAFPVGDLTLGQPGDLYGTSSSGGHYGGSCSGGFFGGCGVIFKMHGSGKETVLHRFSGMDGEYPHGGLLPYKGSLYGTASAGGNSGTSCGGSGCGVVFKLTP